MSEQFITCSKCNNKIPFSAALANYAAAELQRKEERLQADFEKREEALRQEFEKQQAELVKKSLKDAESRAKKAAALELEDLKNQLKESAERETLAKEQELKLRKQVREVEKKQAELDLEIERKVSEQVQAAAEANAKRIAEDHARQLSDKDRKLTEMHQKLIEMERKIAQGSQQAQGEAAEIALEETLGEMFPGDEVRPVAKGRNGADMLLVVKVAGDEEAGKVLIESKDTKNWEEKWIKKLKDDQREVGAEHAVIVTSAFPKDETRRLFERNGVWVTDVKTAPGLITALRATLFDLHAARKSAVDEHEKKSIVYRYLTGPQFRQRIEAIVEAFQALLNDIDAEQAAYQRLWNKRRKEIDRIIKSTVGMWGDLQGIAGAKSLPRIEALELPCPEDTQ